MQTQYSYEATLAASEKIDWRIEDIIGGENDLQRVTVPTLVSHCLKDALVSFDEGRFLAMSIPNARFVDSRNHLILENGPACPRFCFELRRFLESEEPGRSP